MKKAKLILCIFVFSILTFFMFSNVVKADYRYTGNKTEIKEETKKDYLVKKKKNNKKKKKVEVDEDGVPKLKIEDLEAIENGEIKEYPVDCADWEDFNDVWNVIKLGGPFLYIIFAAFDFFKIVMAGDEEAIKKAKKTIPKRLIIFIIFLLVPFVVEFIAGTFGTHNANNLQVFKCIVKGSD